MFFAQDTLDFHIFDKLDHYDVEKILTEFLEDSSLKGLSQVLIITGKGEVVRPLVKKFLNQSKFVNEFRTAGYFNGQNGAFEVELM